MAKFKRFPTPSAGPLDLTAMQVRSDCRAWLVPPVPPAPVSLDLRAIQVRGTARPGGLRGESRCVYVSVSVFESGSGTAFCGPGGYVL